MKMEVKARRTIVINTLKPNILYPLPKNSVFFTTNASKAACVKNDEPPRRGRKRSLQHLSYEEKLLKKKLKNREAAQTSRDKKKARMDELERLVQELLKKVEMQGSQIENLKCENQELNEENKKLKKEIRYSRDACALESKLGSAESGVSPLPQGDSSHPSQMSIPPPVRLLLLQMIVYIGWLTTVNTISQIQILRISLTYYFPRLVEMSCEVSKEMVGSSPTLVEPSRPEQPSLIIRDLGSSTEFKSLLKREDWLENSGTPTLNSCNSVIKIESPTESCTQIVTKTEVMPTDSLVTKPQSSSNEMYFEIMSEEVVITSGDLSLYEACDIKPELITISSDSESEDQGYVSPKYLNSPVSESDTFLPALFPHELFPDLPHVKSEFY